MMCCHLGWEFIKEKKENKKTRTRPRKHACVHEKKNSVKKTRTRPQKKTRSRKHTLVQESVHEKENSFNKIKKNSSCFN